MLPSGRSSSWATTIMARQEFSSLSAAWNSGSRFAHMCSFVVFRFADTPATVRWTI